MNADNLNQLDLANTADSTESQLAKIANAIAEPARTRILCSLMDGRARTSTELSIIAEVSPSTASVHLSKLLDRQLVKVLAQGKHRYYQLANQQVAHALEALLQLTNQATPSFVPSTPVRLRLARTCYDHMAGEIAVAIHDYLLRHEWIIVDSNILDHHTLSKAKVKSPEPIQYKLTRLGSQALTELGLGLDIDIASARKTRRRFACACLDWSERKQHIGGALGAALLNHYLKNG